MPNTTADAALRARQLTDDLVGILGALGAEDQTNLHFAARTVIGPLLDAVGVSAVVDTPQGRAWSFEGDPTDVLEQRQAAELDPPVAMQISACSDALVRLLTAHPRAATTVVADLGARLGLGGVVIERGAGAIERIEGAAAELVEAIQLVAPADEDAVYAAQVGVADVLLTARQSLPEVHEHLVLASLAKLVHDAGLREGKLRVAEGGGLVLEFSVRPAGDRLETEWGEPLRPE